MRRLNLDGELAFLLFVLGLRCTGIIAIASRVCPGVAVIVTVAVRTTVVVAAGLGLDLLDVVFFFVDRQEVLAEEVEADGGEVLNVELILLDLLSEELADFAQVHDGLRGRLRLARALAPREEFLLISVNRRLCNQKVVYDPELFLRDAEVVTQLSEELNEHKSLVYFIVVRVDAAFDEDLAPFHLVLLAVELLVSLTTVGFKVAKHSLHDVMLALHLL